MADQYSKDDIDFMLSDKYNPTDFSEDKLKRDCVALERERDKIQQEIEKFKKDAKGLKEQQQQQPSSATSPSQVNRYQVLEALDLSNASPASRRQDRHGMLGEIQEEVKRLRKKLNAAKSEAGRKNKVQRN